MLVIGQAAVPANATVAVFSLPPGLSNFTVYQPGTPQAVYIGGTAVSSANGMLVPVTPLNQENYSSGRGTTIYATTGNSTASTFQYIISSGGT